MFWHGNMDTFWHYKRKSEIEQENKGNNEDTFAWLQGCYFRDALTSVYHMLNPMVEKSSPKYPYPKRPYNYEAELDEASAEKLERTKSLINAHNLELTIKVNKLKKERTTPISN